MGPASTITTHRTGPHLSVGFDERMSAPRTALFGTQHLLALTGIWLFPGIIGSALGLTQQETGWITQGCFLMTGIITILQSSRLLRLPIVQGPTAAFMLAIISTGLTFGPGTAFGSMAVAGLLFAAVSIPLKGLGLFGYVAKIASNPIVFGTLFVIIGAQLAAIGLSGWFGSAGADGFGLPFLLVSIVTAVSVVAFNLLGGNTVVRRAAVFLGIVLGTVVALVAGLWTAPDVSAASLVGVPHFLPFGFDVKVSAVVLMLLAFLQAGTESAGMYQMIGGWGGEEVDTERTNRGLFTEFLGSAFGALFSGIGTTSYPENAGIVRMSGIGSRFVTLAAGVAAVVLAFIPAVGLFVAGLPGPVLAAASTILFGIIAMSGVQLLGSVEWDDLNMMVAAPAFIVALGTQFLPAEVLDGAPEEIRGIITSPMMVGVVMLIVLHVTINLGLRPWLERRASTGRGSFVAEAIGQEGVR